MKKITVLFLLALSAFASVPLPWHIPTGKVCFNASAGAADSVIRSDASMALDTVCMDSVYRRKNDSLAVHFPLGIDSGGTGDTSVGSNCILYGPDSGVKVIEQSCPTGYNDSVSNDTLKWFVNQTSTENVKPSWVTQVLGNGTYNFGEGFFDGVVNKTTIVGPLDSLTLKGHLYVGDSLWVDTGRVYIRNDHAIDGIHLGLGDLNIGRSDVDGDSVQLQITANHIQTANDTALGSAPFQNLYIETLGGFLFLGTDGWSTQIGGNIVATGYVGASTSLLGVNADGDVVRVSDSTGVGFANPTNLIGLTAHNGTLGSAERSDATHALDQSITPRMTGAWKFVAAVTDSSSLRVALNDTIGGNSDVLGREGIGGYNGAQIVLDLDPATPITSSADQEGIFDAPTFGNDATGSMTGLFISIAGQNKGSAYVTTTTYSERISDISLGTNQTITNDYGINIGNISNGSTINDAIKTGTGLVSLGDRLLISGGVHSATDTITGALTGATFAFSAGGKFAGPDTFSGNTATAAAYFNAAKVLSTVPVNSSATNKYLQQVSSGAPTFAQVAYGDLSGAPAVSGTSNIIAKFTETTTLGNSGVTDNGTTVATAESLAVSSHGATFGGQYWGFGTTSPNFASVTGAALSISSPQSAGNTAVLDLKGDITSAANYAQINLFNASSRDAGISAGRDSDNTSSYLNIQTAYNGTLESGVYIDKHQNECFGCTNGNLSGSVQEFTFSSPQNATTEHPFINIVGDQATTTALISGINFFNTTSNRDAEFSAYDDSASNSAGLAFYTASAGTLNRWLYVNHLGNVVDSNSLKVDANDTVGGSFRGVGSGYFGGVDSAWDNVASTSTTTGSFISKGGIGDGGALNVATTGNIGTDLTVQRATYMTDAALAVGANNSGNLVIGNVSGQQLQFDLESIQSWSNTVPTTLNINQSGGSILLGNALRVYSDSAIFFGKTEFDTSIYVDKTVYANEVNTSSAAYIGGALHALNVLEVTGVGIFSDSVSVTKGIGVGTNVKASGNIIAGQGLYGDSLILTGNGSGNGYFANEVNFDYNTNSAALGVINGHGYHGGTSQFRDVYIEDGKGNSIVQLIASTQDAYFSNLVSISGELEAFSTTNFSYGLMAGDTAAFSHGISASLFNTSGNIYGASLHASSNVYVGNAIVMSSVDIWNGSGAPSFSSAKGSFYLRTDGSAANNRLYINTDGGSTWTYIVTGI